MKIIRTTVPGFPEATLEGYLLDCEITLGQETNRPAVLVLPGGGYLYCSPREAEPVALSYTAGAFISSCCGIPPVMMPPALLR